MATEAKSSFPQIVRFGERIEDPKLGSNITSLSYLNPEIATRRDACLITVQPGGRSTIYRVAEKEVVLTDVVIEGRGSLVRFHPDSGIEVHDIDAAQGNPYFKHTVDTVFCYLATTPLKVLGTNSPPYTESQEEELDLDSPNLPTSFKDTLVKKQRG